MPPKIRQLVADLRKAGFDNTGRGKGSHRQYEHRASGTVATICGHNGDDAKPYLIKHVKEKIEEAKSKGRKLPCNPKKTTMKMIEHEIKALAGKCSRFIRWSDEDNCYIGSLPDFEKDCTHGETLEEVNRNLQEVAEMYIEGYMEKGMELPQHRAMAISPSPFRETGNEKSIARLRKSQGLSQKDFAAVLGVSPSTLVKWEHGIRRPCGPSAKLLYLIEKHPELINS